MKKHANLSLFIPHIGCTHKCVFCDQREISGTLNPPRAEDVICLCDAHLPAEGKNAEIAFFGGSFTAIPRAYMLELLEAAYPFVKCGRAAGIRVSTRPDAVDDEVLEILKSYGATCVELGAQCLDDEVLSANGRGHTVDDVKRAAALVKAHDLALGLQMMIGLYKQSERNALDTAEEIIALGADCTRIYPTLVLENTELCRLFRAGEYAPLSLECAVELCAALLKKFGDAGIPVIRVGLHDDVSLRANLVAGPYHSAFGELCMARVYRKRLETLPICDGCTVLVAKGELSKALGQKKENIEYFAKKGVRLCIRESAALTAPDIKLTQE